MAEFVEQRIQEMVPEIEELERLGLLETQEVRKLIQKRRHFEYQVAKKIKGKSSFMNYVLFDIKLLELISIRRQKLSMFKQQKLIDHAIILRVQKTLCMMSRRWPSHIDIWKLRISFLKSHKAYNEVSLAFMQMTQFHGNDEKVWVLWAQWEMEGRKNFQQARTILLSRAPLYHPHSPTLMKEHFRLELLYIEFLKKKSVDSNLEGLEEIIAENREKVLDCAAPSAIYNAALKDFDSADVLIEFCFIANQFPFARKLTKKIYNDVITKYGDDNSVWRMKGRLVLEGSSLVDSPEGVQEGDNEGSEEAQEEAEGKKLTPKEKLEKLFEMYDQALDQVGVSFLEYYLQNLFQLLDEVWGAEEFMGIISQKIFSVMKKEAAQLTVLQFLIWFELASHLKLSLKEIKEILNLATAAHPTCPHIQMKILPYSTTTMKEKKQIVRNLSGKIGAKICISTIKSCKKIAEKKELFEICCNHPDPIIAKETRLYRLENFKGPQALKNSRIFYKKYSLLPPFFSALHVSMMKRELAEPDLSLPHLREVFEKAIEQCGAMEPNVWICYSELERKRGSLAKASAIKERVEQTLDPKLTHDFIDAKFAVESSLTKGAADESQVVVDCPEKEEDWSRYEFWASSSLPPLFEEELPLMYSAVEERKRFFASLVRIQKEIQNHCDLESDKVDRFAWERILGLIHRGPVSLLVKKVDVDAFGTNHEAEKFIVDAERKFNNLFRIRKGKLSDELRGEYSRQKGSAMNSETKKLLDASETLKPEFLQQKQIIPYYISSKVAKKERKREEAKTKGSGWFNMKAPEITPEVKRDLEILKMRSILNPQRHYKRNDMKETPKYFQLGEVIDSPLDFHSSRIPVKQRKRNLADEIIHDENVLRYQKRKFKEIIEKKEMKKRRLMSVKNSKAGKKSKAKGKGAKGKKSRVGS